MPYLVAVYVQSIDDARVMHTALKAEPDLGRVVGVYRLPRKDDVETCPGLAGGCKATTWTRDPYGVWVHACGRRMTDWRSRIRRALLDVLGINLLPRDITPAMFQNPETWDHKPQKRAPISEETGTRKKTRRR